MKSLVQYIEQSSRVSSLDEYIQESINIDKYYDEYGEPKSHDYDLAKLKKGDTIYFLKNGDGTGIVELKVSKVKVGKNTSERAWWGNQYECQVYVDKNDEDIEYIYAHHHDIDGVFNGWYVDTIFILTVAVMYTDKRTGEYGSIILEKIALDKEDIEKETGKLSKEVIDELKKRRTAWPERYINKTLEKEFKKYDGKEPDKTYNTTVGMLIKWMKQGGTKLEDWYNIEQLVKYCFDNSMSKFKKFLKIIDKQEIEIKQYNVGKDTPEVVLLTYLGDYPIAIDEADEDDEYTGMDSLETFLSYSSKKKKKK